MRNFFPVILAALVLASCNCSPNGPATKPLVNAGNDTTVYILDTLTFHGTVTTGDSIIMRRWDFTGDGAWDDSAAVDTTFTFAIPETSATAITTVFQVENSKGEKAMDTLTITVLSDSVVLAHKIAFAPDSSLLWYTAFTYNAETLVTKETRYEADTVTGWAVLTYSSSALVKKEHYNADGSKAETEEYLPTRKNIYFATGTLFGYDSLTYTGADLSQMIFFTADNTEQYRCSFTYTNGKLTQKTYASTTSILNGSYVTYEYSEQGRLAKEISHTASGAVTGWNAMEYATLHRMQQ